MGAFCCCIRPDSPENSSLTPLLIDIEDTISPTHTYTSAEGINTGSSGAHHCLFCQSIIIDIKDESTSNYSFDLQLYGNDTRGKLENCALFMKLADDITLAELDSRTTVHVQVACRERDTWYIKLYLRYTTGERIRHGREHFFYIYTQLGDPANELMPRLTPNLDPATEASFNTARGWLSECQENHPNCRKETDEKRPTRLLKIPEWGEDVRTLQLVDAKSEHSYVALSYCWGGDQPCKLTKKRLREGGIFRIADLPQTIQDAIEVSRNLKITFIWIDALCIVQDDTESMWSELEKMPAIYSNAIVTISAATAATCYDGFLKPRRAVEFNGVAFRLRLRTASGTEGYIYLAPWKEASQLKGVQPEPINDRAWTLQEHVASPRVLYYSFQQLHWICRGGIRADGGFCPTDKDTPWKGGSIYRIFALSQTTPDMVDPPISAVLAQHDEYASWRRNWSRLLSDYQARRLTNLDDKLVAISAIGTLFARYMNTEFIAGLFERDLGIDLLWSRVGSSEAQPRPTKYRAPSWSWASVDSKTENSIAATSLLMKDDVTIEVLPWPDQLLPTPQARIGLVPLELQIRAWITKVRLRNEGAQREMEGCQWQLPTQSIIYSFDTIDPELDKQSVIDIHLMEIYWYPTPVRRRNGIPNDEFAGLMALKQAGQDRYTRVGYFSMELASLYGQVVSPGERITRQTEPRRRMARDTMQSQWCTVSLA